MNIVPDHIKNDQKPQLCDVIASALHKLYTTVTSIVNKGRG